MRYIIMTMLLGLFLLGVAQEVSANQSDCLPVDKAIEKLKGEHDEILISTMKDAKGVPMAVWANLETGSWSIVYLSGDESNTQMCMLDFGSHFQVGR